MPSEMLDEKAIFNVARQIGSPDARAEYLRQACGTDSGLREAVQVLLHAYEEQASFLESPPPVGVAATIDQPAAECPGTVIGPYKLIEQIGEGGMGAVWMAQQSEPVRRVVALKLIKAGMDSRQVIARFEAERQALALMDHPNISKVLDGGTTPSGRPYFVMDLVKGVPITRYCDDHHLTPRQRLELFVPVCQAVQHAHQKGVIHRDLKPSNVLVALYDGRPVPKVIDFGVAKAAGQALTDKTLVTGFGAIVGTLEYMSPEQAEVNQLDIDTRSDVYSLGVLLYELLAGSPPFSKKDLEKAGMLEMLRVIREQEPSRPSTKLSTADGLPTLAANRGTEPSKLTRLVRGEPDWIVMKALEKDRNRRYETATGFAMDVQRYLADEPVLACPPSAGYRLRKFARRNRGGLAAAALALFVLVLLGSGIGWVLRDRSAREAEAARQRGERQARVAGAVESIFADVDRLEVEQRWPEALEAGRRAGAAVAGGEADPTTVDRVDQRLRDLELIDRLERIRLEAATHVEGQFNYAGADRDYARVFRDYGVDVDELPAETAIDRLKGRPVFCVALASALDFWVFVRRAGSEADVARWKRLVAVARGIDPDPLRDRVRATWGRPVGEVRDDVRRLADSIDVRAQHPASLVTLAMGLRRVRHPDAAIRILRDARYAHPGDFWLNFLLGEVLYEQNDREGSIPCFAAAVATRPRSSGAHNNLGAVLAAQKQADAAIACFRKAIELDPKSALAHRNIGHTLQTMGRLDESIAEYRKAVELAPRDFAARTSLERALQGTGRGDEAVAVWKELTELAAQDSPAHQNLARVLRRNGRVGEAIAARKKVIELDPQNANAHHLLGLVLQDGRLVAEALAEHRTALELDPKNAFFHKCLGDALRANGRPDEAVAAYRKAVELKSDYAEAHAGLGDALGASGQPEEAIAEYRKVAELSPTEDAHANLVLALQRQGRVDEAMAERKKRLDRDPKNAAEYFHFGNDLKARGDPDGAELAYREAVRMDGDRRGAAIDSLADLLLSRGKVKEAVATYQTIVALDPRDAAAHYRLGNALKADGDSNRALASYRAAAVAMETKNPADADSFHNAACCRALTAAAQAQAGAPDAARLAREESDRAMAWLTKAAAAGLADPVRLGQDEDLNPLRDRDDFRKLLADLVAKAPPIDRARYHICLSQWDQAAAEYAKADLGARPVPEDAYGYAGLFLIRGDRAGYDRFCQDVIRRAGPTATPWEGYVLARMCVVARTNPADPASAVRWANQAVAKTHTAWDVHVLGLAQYRAGQFEQALQSFAQADVQGWSSRDLNWFGLALVHHRLGHSDEARNCLAKGVRWLEREGPPGPGRPAKIHPMDWLQAQLLRREAEELVGPQAKEKPDKQ